MKRRLPFSLLFGSTFLAAVALAQQPRTSAAPGRGLGSSPPASASSSAAPPAMTGTTPPPPPPSPPGTLAAAIEALHEGRYPEADKHAQQAAATTPADKPASIAIRAEALYRTGKVQDALKLLDTVKDAPGPGGREVRLLMGEYRIATGHRQDAEDPLMKIIGEYNSGGALDRDQMGLAIVGRAAFLLRVPKDANTAFKESERIEKKNVRRLLWWADLFLEKYDPGHAEEVTKEALAIDPRSADAKVMLARVKLEQTLDFEAADKLAKEALSINPKHTGAFAVRASISLHDMDLTATEAAIAQGLQINPNDLELLSLRAAAKFLGDDKPGYEAAKKEVFTRNAEYGQFYGIVGDFAEWEHRYDDIVSMMKESTKVDPEDGKAWAQLGLTQMRSGDETGGMASLKQAWSKDHFNIRVYNTLNLYEQTIPNAYDMGADGVFKIRYPKDEKAVLERYVPQMLGEAWGSMKARYAFVPQNPVQVEMYSNREQFSVRTSGLPNIGIQGVCFGRVVAAMSPKSEPFNWGNVIWHELGHVFAIQLSKNHVPRWFTEGLSEYETIARRPEWQRELDPELYLAIRRGTLPGAVDMNSAFTHASDASDVTVAYYAASQLMVFTVERFGMPKVVQALKLWGDGVRTPEVIQRAFGMSAPDYDKAFRTWAMARMKRYDKQFIFDDRAKPLDEAKAAVAANPRDAAAHAALGLTYGKLRKIDESKKEVEEALKLDPNNHQAHYLAAKLAAKDQNAQLAHMVAIQKAGGDGYTVRMGIAGIAEDKKDKAGLREALEAAHRFDPAQGEPIRALWDLAREEKREGDELELLRQLAPLEQHDRKVWRVLLDKLVAAKKWDEARSVGESAIFVDVEHPPTHIAYAKALSATGDHAKAAFELESALLGNAPPKEAATAHALLANELVLLKSTAEAKKHLTEAQRLDPENAEAKAVKIP
jgi:tetratricopeptide (TPR) repeat protein